MATKQKRLAIPEVVAPGGSPDAISAALAFGADSVYVGVGELNARVRATNLSPDELRVAVPHLHSRHARLFVALNVPVSPATLDRAIEVIAAAWLAGADALILRDPVLVELCRLQLPDFKLHASTQAGIHDVRSARRFEEMGVVRAILARECTLSTIRKIHRACPGLELEAFVLGALCFGISGHCLLGEAVGGRSGNYGHCLQSCRLPFFTAAGLPLGHLLSMRDLDLLRRIPELAEAGIGALKIEGRMKPPAWVGCATGWTRAAAAAAVSGGMSAAEHQAFRTEIAAIFARPFTDGYLDGCTDASHLTFTPVPGHEGLELPFRVVAPNRRPPPVSGRPAADGGPGGGPGARLLELQPPLPLSVRDGLLLTLADGSRQAVPILDLQALDGRSLVRAKAGRPVRVVLPPGRAVAGVAIHSCQALRSRYEPPSEGETLAQELARIAAGPPAPAMSVVRMELVPGQLTLLGREGRFSLSARYPVATENARGAGFDVAKGRALFPEAEISATPGLFLPPSQLKELRRRFREEFEAARQSEVAALVTRLQAAAVRIATPFLASDRELAASRPLAISRVTGLPAGEIRTSGGDRLLVEPRPGGTVIRSLVTARFRRNDS